MSTKKHPQDPPAKRKQGGQVRGEISRKELAQKAGVSVPTLWRWEKDEGINLDDIEAVKARAAKVHDRNETAEDEKEAKLRKLKAEADLIEHKLKVQRGEFVSSAEMNAEGVRMGMAVGTIFAKIPEELPPLLAGQDAATIKKLLTKWQREKRTELSQYQSPIKFDQ